MRLLLHIGTEKTGTTSTQIWAANNRDGLIKQGVFYSKLLGHSNHLAIYLWALSPELDDEGFFQIGLPTLKSRQKFQAELPDKLAKEVDDARKLGCHTFLISNEHCHSRLSSEVELLKLHGLLSPLFETMDIFCSLRPQVDLALSLSSTASRVFLRVDRSYFERIGPGDLYYNYDKLEQRWAAVFGAGALDFVAFRRAPDTVAGIAQRLGLDLAALHPQQRFNEALDIRTMALANALAGMARKPGVPYNAFARVSLDGFGCTERLQLGLELAQKVQSKFADGNAAFAQRRPSIAPADLDPDWSSYDHPSNLDILETPCVFSEKLVEMTIALNMRNALAAIGQKLAEVERALTRRNIDNAERFLREAEASFANFPSDHPSKRGHFAARFEKVASEVKKARETVAKPA